MALPEILVSGRGMKVTDSIRSYVEDKLGKYSEIYSSVVNRIDVNCVQNISARGIEQDFKVEILAYLPRVTIRVEKKGADVYGLIDLATDVLIRKVKKQKDQYRRRDDVKSNDLKDEEAKTDDTFISYVPKISKTKVVDNCKPMLPEEAVEQMELNDYDIYLFKDSKTGRCSVVYKRENNTYGLVQLSLKAK